MWRIKCALLMFFVLSICTTLPPCVAKDVGKQKQQQGSKEYANVVAQVTIVNAVCDRIATIVITKKDAATHDVAILTTTPTVEVKAKTIVDGKCYQRLCQPCTIVMKYTSGRMGNQRLIGLPIIPGLRGC